MLQGIRVFELHKEHGLHVHLVTNQFIDVNRARVLAEKAGWGRIHVKRIPPERVTYLAKYLSKRRPECLKRWRLWAGFGEGWERTKVRDVIANSLFSQTYRECKEKEGWIGKGGFFKRMSIVRERMITIIEGEREAGLGLPEMRY